MHVCWHAHIEDFFMLGGRGKMQIDWKFILIFFFFFFFVGASDCTLDDVTHAYSALLANAITRYCEQDQNRCRRAILVPF